MALVRPGTVASAGDARGTHRKVSTGRWCHDARGEEKPALQQVGLWIVETSTIAKTCGGGASSLRRSVTVSSVAVRS